MKALLAEATWSPKKKYFSQDLAVSGSLAWKNPQFGIIDQKLPIPRADELLVRVKYY